MSLVTISAKIPKEQGEKFEMEASEAGLSKSDYLRSIIDNHRRVGSVTINSTPEVNTNDSSIIIDIKNRYIRVENTQERILKQNALIICMLSGVLFIGAVYLSEKFIFKRA
jgi:hypothetical protein